ncbi:hypothetical protein D3C75_757730 [compost metagenome]
MGDNPVGEFDDFHGGTVAAVQLEGFRFLCAEQSGEFLPAVGALVIVDALGQVAENGKGMAFAVLLQDQNLER